MDAGNTFAIVTAIAFLSVLPIDILTRLQASEISTDLAVMRVPVERLRALMLEQGVPAELRPQVWHCLAGASAKRSTSCT